MSNREYDMSDLADVVQRNRMAMWSGIGLKGFEHPWHEDLEDYPVVISMLKRLLAEAADTRTIQQMEHVLGEYQAVYAALLEGPRKPPLEDLLDRYLKGELGDRTVRYVMGWDSPWTLMEELQKRKLPIFHGALTDKKGDIDAS